MFKPVQNASPVSWVCACDTCIADGPCEKALSTARPPSVSVGADAYMTVCGLGYIMWPGMEVGTDVVTMVAGRLTVAERERECHLQTLISRWRHYTECECVSSLHVPVDAVLVWDISGLLSVVLDWTWMVWSCWGIAPPDRHTITYTGHMISSFLVNKPDHKC